MAAKLKSTSHIKVDSRYTSSSGEQKVLFPFPNRDINPASKGPEYDKKWAEAIYSMFLNGRMAWGVQNSNLFAEERSYSTGTQSTDKLKKFLLDEAQTDGDASSDDLPIARIAKREGWLNVLWENLSIGPKVMDSMHGMFDQVDFDLYVNAIDANSLAMQENAKYVALVEGQNRDWQIQYKKKAGLPVDEDIILPKSNQELAAIEMAGGFKLNIAKSMEKLSRHSFEVSKWSGVIKKKLTDDLVTIGICAVRDRYDREDGMFKAEYLDPARLAIQFSTERDFDDAEYGGYFRLMNISDVKRRMPALTDEVLRGIAKNNQGLFGNPTIRNDAEFEGLYNTMDSASGSYGWFDFKVCVFEAAWIDWDNKRALSYDTARGQERYNEISYETILSESDKKKEKITTVRKVRQCSLIVGTNHVFDTGLMYMGARPERSVPKLPFHVEKLHGPSLIRRSIPIMDQISNIWFKYQNSVAKMIESGFAVDFGMIMNISDGKDKKYDVNGILKMWKQTGILPFLSSRYGNYQGGATTPVQALPNDFMDKLQATQVALQMQFQLFEQTTGINPVTLGQTPSPDAPVATTEAAMQGTVNIIRPISTALFELKQSAGECMVSRIQTGIRVSSTVRKAYAGVIGENDINVLRLAEKTAVRYGLSMKARPDQLFKQKLVSYIEIALASGRDGKAGIELTDGMMLEEKLWRGADIADIRNELTWIIERRKQENALEKKALIEQQSKENQDLEAEQQQGAMALHQMKLQQITTSETEKRKTARVKANTDFLQELIKQSHEENTAGGITDATHDRLRLAMNVAGRVGDLSQIDLAAEVGRLEQGMNAAPSAQQSNTLSVSQPV